MVENFPYLLLLLVVIVGLVMLSNRLKVAYPILLVLAGLGMSFIPNLPQVTIDPQLVFIIFLPALLYYDTFGISRKELWKWRRVILSFAFIVVFITAAVIAWVTNLLLPGFPIALGFLLGGIISSTDAVSTSAIVKFVNIPRRLSTIIESESLLNDASSLIVFRFALIVVSTGQFIWQEVAIDFVWVVTGGVAIGLAVAWVLSKLHKYLPTDATMDIILTLISPYIMYIIADRVGVSGVLATVAGGLYISFHKDTIFAAPTRVKAFAVWDSLVFVLNGLAFALIGLNLPHILEGIEAEGISLTTATYYGLIITGVLIAVRIFCAYGSVLVTLIMKNFITVADSRFSMKAMGVPLILGWAGMRGILSLAVALSIPLTLANGDPFPHRSLILYITFIVILVTLVLQGLTLPFLIKKVHIPDFGDHIPDDEAEDLIRKKLAEAAINFMNEHYKEDIPKSFLLQNQQHVWNYMLQVEHCNLTPDIREKYISILQHQRSTLKKLNRNPKISGEVIVYFENQLNLEESKWTREQ